jgi:hypothetical protein
MYRNLWSINIDNIDIYGKLEIWKVSTGNTKQGSITVPLTSWLTGLD